MSNETEKFVPETQKERWVKYGANVALASIVVIVLSGLITYMAQKFPRRVDTTSAGMYSLKPQTVNLIKDLKQPIKLVSLYQQKDERGQDRPLAGPVSDLIDEYARKGKNITCEVIDPVQQPAKIDSLMAEAIQKYGGAIKTYKDFLAEFNTTFDQLKKLTDAESTAVGDVKSDSLGED